MANLVTCNGAQLGIFLAVSTFCEEEDEIVCVEPCFDAYSKAAALSGCGYRGVPLRQPQELSSVAEQCSGDFTLDLAELEAALTDRTKILFLNTPHNPTGKVFSRDELQGIADVVSRYPNLIVVSDEVYEFSVFDGAVHERFATLSGGSSGREGMADMFDRTLSLFSAGKTFSCTGWRIGYMVGPEKLVRPLIKAQAAVAFASATPLEMAIASAFQSAEANGYFDNLSKTMQNRRDLLLQGLRGAGLRPVVPGGGYFTMVETGDLCFGEDGGDQAECDQPIGGLSDRPDFRLAEQLTAGVGVTGIPMCPFYSSAHRHLADNLLRLAHCKTEDELVEAGRRFSNIK
jgi:aspartate/methionine/tyrosine aminotransferase